MKQEIAQLILLSILVISLDSKNVSVDVSLSTSSGTTYPTLNQAFQALLSSKSKIIDYNNSIALLPSCASKTLTFSNGTLSGLTTGGSLNITFPPLNQTIYKYSDCSQLPVINLASLNSFIQFSNLASLVISGVNLQFSATNNTNQLFNITTVTFSNFCFNNTEPSLGSTGTLSSSLVKTFKFNQVLTLLMTNGVYTYDSFKSVTITGANQVNLSTIEFYVLNTSTDLTTQALNVSSLTLAPTVVNISNMTVTCDSGGIKMPTLFYSSNITSVNISSMQMWSCNFNLPRSSATTNSMINFQATENVILNNFYVNNSTIGSSTVNENYMSLVFIYGSFFVTSINAAIENWIITNSSIQYYSASLIIDAPYGVLLGNVSIQNMSLINSSVNYYGYFIYVLAVLYPPVNTTTEIPNVVQVSQIQIIGNTIQSYSKVLYFVLSDSSMIFASLEVFQVNATSLTFKGNTISGSSLIQFESMLLNVMSLLAENNTLTNSGFIIKDDLQLTSVFVLDSIFANLTVSQSSGVISHNIPMSSVTIQLEGTPTSVSTLYFIECNSVNLTGGYLFAITRPFIVSNCTFTNLFLNDSSNVIQSNNPMIIVANNTFNQLTLFDSQILNLIDYLKIISPNFDCVRVLLAGVILSSSLYYIADTVTPPLTTLTAVYPFYLVESIMFRSLGQAAAAYYQARNASWAYDSLNSVYILSVIGNLFTNINASSSDNLFGISQFEPSNSSVTILNNTLYNVVSTGSGLFSSEDAFRVFWSGNNITNSMLQGFFLTLSSDYVNNLIIASDFIDSIIGLVGYSIESLECDNINILNITAKNLFITQAFITVSCGLLFHQMSQNNSRFENVTCQSSQTGFVRINFLVLSVLSSQDTSSNIFLYNNYFYNHTTIENRGYISKLFDESLVLIFAVNSSISIDSNTFDTGNFGGSVMKISIPSITIKDCTFNSLFYSNRAAAFNLVFETLWIVNSSYTNTQGTNINGIGLMMFTNPNLKTIKLNVMVHNCSFFNNSAATSTILSADTTMIQMVIVNSSFSGNVVSQTESGLIEFYSISNSLLNLQNSVFEIKMMTATSKESNSTNFAGSVLFIEKASGPVVIQASNCSVYVDTGALGNFFMLNSNENVTLQVSGFNYTYSVNAGSYSTLGILQADQVQATFTELTISNIVFQSTPLFLLNCSLSDTGIKSLLINSGLFENLYIDSGVILVDSYQVGDTISALNNLSVLITNSLFTNIEITNTQQSQPGEAVSVGIIRSLTAFLGRSCDNTGTFAVKIQSCNFTQVTGDGGGLIFSAMEPYFDGILQIESSIFQSMGSITNDGWYFGGSISSHQGGIINISPESSALSISACNGNSTLSLKKNLTFAILDSSFQNVSASDGGILFWESQIKPITTLFQNNQFADIQLTGSGGLIFSSYTPNTQQSQQASLVTTFNVMNCTFGNISAQDGGVIYLDGSSNLYQATLSDSSFRNIRVTGPGGILRITDSTELSTSNTYRLLTAQQTGSIIISGDQFGNISAQNGGILYEDTPANTLSILLENSQFNNITSQVRGGILYLNQPNSSIISNNSFVNSSANTAGSIIYAVSGRNIDLANITELNDISGGNSSVSSFAFAPTNLKVEIFDTSSSPPTSLPIEDDENSPYSPIILNITSYSLQSLLMQFTLVNIGTEGVYTVFDESSDSLPSGASITIDFTFASGSVSHSYSSNTCAKSICQFDPSGIILFGNAGDLIKMNVIYQSANYQQNQTLNLTLRACLPGEVNETATQQCFYCGQGTYSLSPSDSECTLCPEGAECMGGNSIILQEGYYKSLSSNETLLIVPCNDSGSRCLGGYENNCSEMFSGPVCLQCNLENGYITTADGKCSSCYSKPVVVILGIILVLLSLFYELFMVIAAYKNSRVSVVPSDSLTDPDDNKTLVTPGVYMVIFATFTQITSIISSSDTNTDTISEIPSFIGTITNTGTQVQLSLRCLIHLEVSDQLDAMRVQLLFITLTPIVKVAIVTLFEIFRLLIVERGRNAMKRSLIRIGTVAVVLVILEQPSIIGSLSDYIYCNRLDPYFETLYITKSNSIECQTDQYIQIRNNIVIPAIVGWGFVVPLILFIILRFNHKHLFDSEDLLTILGNLYAGYTSKAYYWGIMLFVIKMGLSVLNSVLIKYQSLKILIFVCFFHIYYKYLKKVQPYETASLERSERYSIFSYLMLLLVQLLKSNIETTWIQTVLSVVALIAFFFTETYILFQVFSLYMKKFAMTIKERKRSKRDKKIRQETLDALRMYHKDQPDRIDKYFRRYAISIPLSDKYLCIFIYLNLLTCNLIRLRRTDFFDRDVELKMRRQRQSERSASGIKFSFQTIQKILRISKPQHDSNVSAATESLGTLMKLENTTQDEQGIKSQFSISLPQTKRLATLSSQRSGPSPRFGRSSLQVELPKP